MRADARGWRVALAPDGLVNAQLAAAARFDLLSLLDNCGYGVIVMPPPGPQRLLLEVIADQVAEFAHHGYAVVAIGAGALPGHGLHWRSFTRLMQLRGAAPIPRHNLRLEAEPDAERRRLGDFLSGYDLPEAECRRWRG